MPVGSVPLGSLAGNAERIRSGEFYWLNKCDPNSSLERLFFSGGVPARSEGKFGLSPLSALQIFKLFMTPNRDLNDKHITEFFDDEFFESLRARKGAFAPSR